jgi:HK97 family phage major capsid protein
MSDLSEILKLVKEQSTELDAFRKKAAEQIANTDNTVSSAAKVAEEVQIEIKKLQDELAANTVKFNDLKQQVATSAADKTKERTEKAVSWGEQFVKDIGEEDLKRLANKQLNSASTFVKMVTTAAASAGSILISDRVPGIFAPFLAPLTLASIVPTGNTTSTSIEYVQEKVFTNSAGMVAEGTMKPESNITFEKKDAVVRTIAHWILVTRQALMDVPQLESYINNRMVYGLRQKVEDQLLNGDGTGENLNGFMTQAAAAPANTAGTTMVDVLVKAIADVFVKNGVMPDGIVLNAADQVKMALLKDSTGQYLFGNPLSNNGMFGGFNGIRNVWSAAIPVNNFLIGAFQAFSQIWQREDVQIMTSNEDRDNFVKNLVTILVEARMMLAIYRPSAFEKGNFTIPTS